MQNRYAGDVGDFLKFGLLRQLCSSNSTQAELALGVVWYLASDESHNGDGKHVAYLQPGSAASRALRPLDPQLFDRLQHAVHHDERSIAALKRAGVLPPSAQSFDEPLDLSGFATNARSAREEHRADWLRRSLEATFSCDLVFVDPDNGIRRTDHSVPAHRNKSEKHAYLNELHAFISRGQSVVAYHHADRSEPVDQQAHRRMSDVAEALRVEPLAAVRASRGTVCLFLVVPADAHREQLRSRVEQIERSAWGSELQIYWRASAAGAVTPGAAGSYSAA